MWRNIQVNFSIFIQFSAREFRGQLSAGTNKSGSKIKWVRYMKKLDPGKCSR